MFIKLKDWTIAPTAHSQSIKQKDNVIIAIITLHINTYLFNVNKQHEKTPKHHLLGGFYLSLSFFLLSPFVPFPVQHGAL